MEKTYTLSTSVTGSSYGQLVLLDQEGEPRGPADVGLWGTLPSDTPGRVFCGGQIYTSGYGPSPNRMWEAILTALMDHPECDILDVFDPATVSLRVPARPDRPDLADAHTIQV